MGLVDRVSRMVTFLRAGYPTGTAIKGYVPLLALLPRRLSDDEITAIAKALSLPARQPIDTADVGVEITRITDEMPSTDDIERVRTRLTGNHR